MCSITGVGERLRNVLGQIGSKLWFPWQQKSPLTYNGGNDVSTFSRLFFIRPFSYLQVTRTCIKYRTSSNFGQFGPLTTELAALERLKISHRLIIGKWCLHAGSFIFDRIIIKVAGSISGRIRLLTLEWLAWMTKTLHFRTWISLRPVGQSWSIYILASLGVREGCIMFWGRLDQNSGVHGNRKPPLTYNGENGVSTFSRLLLIRSFLYLQVKRTCIKA